MNQPIHFKDGIPAFETNKNYILVPVDNNPFFRWLQSAEGKGPTFLLTDPFAINQNFYVDLDDNLREDLEIKKREDVLIYTIVTVPKEGFKKATINLLAPIVINIHKKKAKQIVLDGMLGDIKYPLFPSKKNLKVGNG